MGELSVKFTEEDTALMCTAIILVIVSAAFFYVTASPKPYQYYCTIYCINAWGEPLEYPSNSTYGSSGSVMSFLIGVQNHMGCAEYAEVRLKIWNSSNVPSNASCPAQVWWSDRKYVSDKDEWRLMLNISILGYSFNDSVGRIESIIVNGQILNGINVCSLSGVFFRVYFELWLYNENAGNFSYTGRNSYIWFNVTSPS
jgi:uncharacterized membrane protein